MVQALNRSWIYLSLALSIAIGLSACGVDDTPYVIKTEVEPYLSHVEHGVYMYQPFGFKKAKQFSGFSSGFNGSVSVKLVSQSVAEIAESIADGKTQRELVRLAPIQDGSGNDLGGLYAEEDEAEGGVYRYRLAMPVAWDEDTPTNRAGFAETGSSILVACWFNKASTRAETAVKESLASFVYDRDSVPDTAEDMFVISDFPSYNGRRGVRYSIAATDGAKALEGSSIEVYEIPAIAKNLGMDYIESQAKKIAPNDKSRVWAKRDVFHPYYKYSAERDLQSELVKVVLFTDSRELEENNTLLIYRAPNDFALQEAEAYLEAKMFVRTLR